MRPPQRNPRGHEQSSTQACVQNAPEVAELTQMPPEAQSAGERQGSPKAAVPPTGVVPASAVAVVHSCGSHAKPLAQVPRVGPVCVLDTQVFEAPHQPQPLMGVQPAHDVKRLQGSVVVPASGVGVAVVHSCGSHAKPLAHAPRVGPVCVLDTQEFEAPHQPQPFTGVQPAHDV